MRELSVRRIACKTLALCCFSGAVALPAQSPAGTIVQSRRGTSLVVSFPSLRDAAAEQLRLGSLVAECRRDRVLTTADSAMMAARVHGSAVREDDEAVVELLLVPRATSIARCASQHRESSTFDALGIWVVDDSLQRRPIPVQHVQVFRGATRLVSSDSSRSPVLQVASGAARPAPAQLLRLRFPLELFVPPLGETESDLVVEVNGATGAETQRFTVSWRVLREMVDELLPSRATRLSATSAPSVELPVPDDASLLEARQRLAAGDRPAAAAMVARALQVNQLHARDRRYARAHNTMIFLAGGDDLAARVNVQYLLDEDPCFEWDASAAQSLQEFTAAHRGPDVRCVAHSTPRVLVQSLIVPGFGRPLESSRDRRPRVSVAAVVVGTVGAGLILSARANEQYRDYLDAAPAWTAPPITFPRPRELYDEAERSRQVGAAFVITGTVLYAAQAAWQVWLERRFSARVESVRAYGAQREAARVDLRLSRPASGVGLGVEVKW
jgi:hypothetical protein